MDARDIFRVDFESIFAKKWQKREGQEEMEKGGGGISLPGHYRPECTFICTHVIYNRVTTRS